MAVGCWLLFVSPCFPSRSSLLLLASATNKPPISTIRRGYRHFNCIHLMVPKGRRFTQQPRRRLAVSGPPQRRVAHQNDHSFGVAASPLRASQGGLCMSSNNFADAFQLWTIGLCVALTLVALSLTAILFLIWRRRAPKPDATTDYRVEQRLTEIAELASAHPQRSA